MMSQKKKKEGLLLETKKWHAAHVGTNCNDSLELTRSPFLHGSPCPLFFPPASPPSYTIYIYIYIYRPFLFPCPSSHNFRINCKLVAVI
jgi:hypothetical protein